MPILNNENELSKYLASLGPDSIINQDGLYTNVNSHNPVAVSWLLADDYDTITDPKTVSVTELVQPTIISVLRRRHRAEAVSDVTDIVSRAIGRSVHNDIALRTSKELAAFQEEQLSVELDGYTVRGTSDLWLPLWMYEGKSSRPDDADDDVGAILDWKYTTVFKVRKKDFDEYKNQVNAYAWLANKALNLRTVAGEVTAILDGWSRREADRDPGYPQAKIVKIPLPILDIEDTERWLRTRIAQFDSAMNLPDEKLRVCTPEERWEKPFTWRVVKKGNKKSKRNFYADRGQTRLDAEAFAFTQMDGQYEVIDKEGERTRCDRYCSLRPWCPLYL
jgi:hypothetical protein